MRAHTFFVKMVVGVVSFLLQCETITAAGFPERPIQVLVGWPVGSGVDLMDRTIATSLAKILKQPVIIQNVPGAGGSLVLGRIRNEKPDGYTLFQTNSNQYSQTPFVRTVPYDPRKDFAYLAQHSRAEHYLLCRSDSPWKSFEELIKYAKKNPKKVKYGTGGVGTSTHIAMEYLAVKENLQWIHVPFNSSVEAVTALLGGHIDLFLAGIGPEYEYVKTGQFRPLLCLNEKRSTLLPDLPTILEKGYDFTSNLSYMWAVPANTPKDIQKILEKALLQAFATPEFRECLDKLQKVYAPLGSEALTKAVIEDHQKYGELMKKLGLGIFKK